MAYYDPDSVFQAPRQAATRAPTRTVFSALEWTVILLAKHDTLRSLKAPSRLSRAIGGVLGRGSKSTLADPRLEALRRAAVYAWHHPADVPATEADRFIAAGFRPEQLTVLLDSVAAAGRIGHRAAEHGSHAGAVVV